MITQTRPVHFSRIALRRSLCREDYFEFLRMFWGELVDEVPIWNWHIRIICNEVQKVCEQMLAGLPKKNDLIINVPPGSTKSLTCSIMLLPWLWTRKPSIRFLGGSFTEALSTDFGKKARQLIKSDLYRETFPEIKISPDQDTKTYFANTLKGERISTSTGASVIGRHFHIHVIDDPISPQGARSITDLKNANEWLSETIAQRCVSQALTPLILVMQRLNLDDPTGVRLARTGGIPIRHICLPAELSDEVRPKILQNKYKNGLLDPVRLPPEILEFKRNVDPGPYAYAGQYEQRPVSLTGGIFNVNKIVGPAVPPEPDKFKLVIRFWDKAATLGAGDYTVGVLMGMKKIINDYPIYWVLDVVRKQISTTERELLIRRTAESDRIKYKNIYKVGLEQEPGSGGKDSVIATTQRLDGFHVISERATGSKMDRAHEFSSQIGGENVAIAPGEWNKTYLEELQYFGPLAKHDDQVDASSGAFNFLSRRKIPLGAAGFLWNFVALTIGLYGNFA